MRNQYNLKNITNSRDKFQNISNIYFANVFSQALNTKGVSVSYLFFSEEKNVKQVTIGLFFGAKFVRRCRTKMYSQNKKNKNKNKNKNKKNKNKNKKNEKSSRDINFKKNSTKLKKGNKLIEKVKKVLGANVSMKLINLNSLIKKRQVFSVYKKLRRLTAKLFVKREYLFFDFIHICTLLSEKKISVWAFLAILGTIFKPLQKRGHGMFLYFVKNVFRSMMSLQTTSIVGMKLRIAGRLKGKPRGNTSKASIGRISLTEEASCIENAQTHVHTKFGCFGIKLWIHYKN